MTAAHDEPNLVPLLDLVLQLVMFFMMCANLVMEQVDQTVVLPVAQAARPATEPARDVVFLNVNREGGLLVLGRPRPLTTEEEVASYLREVADDARRRSGGEPETLVIVRAHREASYADVYRVLRRSQEAGLKRVQLRATMARPEGP